MKIVITGKRPSNINDDLDGAQVVREILYNEILACIRTCGEETPTVEIYTGAEPGVEQIATVVTEDLRCEFNNHYNIHNVVLLPYRRYLENLAKSIPTANMKKFYNVISTCDTVGYAGNELIMSAQYYRELLRGADRVIVVTGKFTDYSDLDRRSGGIVSQARRMEIPTTILSHVATLPIYLKREVKSSGISPVTRIRL